MIATKIRFLRFRTRLFAGVLCVVAGYPGTARSQESDSNPVVPAHFHHVHLNVTDPERTAAYYIKVHGAVPTRYAGVADALFTERSFILWNNVAAPPPPSFRSGLWHIGWGAIDVPSRYRWFKDNDVKIYTDLYTLGRTEITYLEGPDGEVIEVNTMPHHRFGHVHFIADDVNATVDWYVKQFGVASFRPPVPKPDLTQVRAWSRSFRIDNVQFIAYNKPDYEPVPPWWKGKPLLQFESSKGTAIDHLAFSYRDIQPVFERMQRDGVPIVEPIRHDPKFNHTSFFVEGPDKVLIEIVQAKPIPEGIWD